tara:strand:+ start:213 stop:755 length:543 start_codon:yes stop_codon:yes gene_type:complete
MKDKNFSELNLDLVFKSNQFPELAYNFKNYKDKLIFESSFWEKVFLCWIKSLLEKKEYSLPKYIFDKHLFSLSLQIINNKEITSLNQKWMRKSGPTDVLSFPVISENYSIKGLDLLELGDLFISLEMACKQSLEYKHSINKEMLWLASHGFLHLMGWEHNDENELNSMLDVQDYLISRLD